LRRELIVQEADIIGTAWLRIDLLRAVAQPVMRELCRKYLDSRLETYRKMAVVAAVKAELDRTSQLQKEIWMFNRACFNYPTLGDLYKHAACDAVLQKHKLGQS
jgi:hypothetical protein